MVRRVGRMLLLGMGLAVGAAALWFLWATAIQYPGLDGRTGCPLGTAQDGHPWIVAAVLSAGAAIGMGRALWKPTFRSEAIALAVLTGAVALVLIFIVAVSYFAGLRCLD